MKPETSSSIKDARRGTHSQYPFVVLQEATLFHSIFRVRAYIPTMLVENRRVDPETLYLGKPGVLKGIK